jgi:hypothetical protein
VVATASATSITIAHSDHVHVGIFHQGGIFRAPGGGEGLALLRDREGIFTPAQRAALGAAIGSAGNQPTNITLEVDGVALARATVRPMAAELERQIGYRVEGH